MHVRSAAGPFKARRPRHLPLLPAAARPGAGPSLDEEIFLAGLPALHRRSHPARHAAASRPGVLGALGIAILDGYGAFATFAEQIMDVETVLLRQIDEALTHGILLRILLLDLQPLDLGFHVCQFC